MHGILAGLGPDCGTGADVLRRRWDDLVEEGDLLVAGDDDTAQAGCARYANELARAAMATLLYDLADFAITSGSGYRSLLVANAYLSGDTGNLPGAALDHLAAVVDGTDVAADAAQATAPRSDSATGVLL
jgi:hypothetical protein